MFYKIVQTNERGHRELCAVPDTWEKRGKLFWPKETPAKIIRMLNNPSTNPGGNNWKEIDCILMRTNFKSLDEAHAEIDNMELQTTNSLPQNNKNVNINDVYALLQNLNQQFLEFKNNTERKLDEIHNMITNAAAAVPPLKSQPAQMFFKPCKTEDDLKELEHNLELGNLETSRLILKSEIEKMSGQRALYKLLDNKVFSRSLLVNYSWAGQSKKGNIKKKPLKVYEKTLNFIYGLCHEVDPTYSKLEFESQMKNNILPHAQRRNERDHDIFREFAPKRRKRNQHKSTFSNVAVANTATDDQDFYSEIETTSVNAATFNSDDSNFECKEEIVLPYI